MLGFGPRRRPNLRAPRFTIRTAMVLVAIVAFASFGGSMWRRSAEYHAKAEEHSGNVFGDTLNARAATSKAFEVRPHRKPTAIELADRRFFELHAEYEERLYEKYRHAARFPWLPVDPDPVFTARE